MAVPSPSSARIPLFGVVPRDARAAMPRDLAHELLAGAGAAELVAAVEVVLRRAGGRAAGRLTDNAPEDAAPAAPRP